MMRFAAAARPSRPVASRIADLSSEASWHERWTVSDDTEGTPMRLIRANGPAERLERTWNWTFWGAILAFEAVGVLLSSQT